ncbi:S-adenosylmethionine mitochondrial carrier protein homolog isoform X2 [Ceratina calcarata]|uniref:S-adenosylmethionine mitochondrial carrier protein homolog isoform X2 n=1 Tax=Ceratina calcarata TaxID=156304 RepID=A0AAJ7RZF5_9HYME|nr:S-adenosylmethionine mitochondrial carrier protein homolog isoform X2 [Ceratina calcarata]
MLSEKNTNDLCKTDIVLTSLISGAFAATLCDFLSFPLDTIKTRLQSQSGFMKSGGFRNLYNGLAPVMMGTGPTAVLFFMTYEGLKVVTEPNVPEQYHSLIHITGASIGEVAACIIRVPVEVVKQRRQAFIADNEKLGLKTLYRGFGSTVMRDMPFCFIQMPLWEFFKLKWKTAVGREVTPVEGAICGAVSDVAKTRIMLSSTTVGKDETRISVMLNRVYREYGIKGLFAGFLPRVGGFTLSGFMFFGVYEKVRELCVSILST